MLENKMWILINCTIICFLKTMQLRASSLVLLLDECESTQDGTRGLLKILLC